MWEEARFSVENAAQNPCLEAGSHVVKDPRPYGNAHGRHSCKPILSEAQKLELLFLNEILVSHPIPLMRQTQSLSSWGSFSAASPRASFRSRQSICFPELCGLSSPSLLLSVFSELLWPMWLSGAVQAGCC